MNKYKNFDTSDWVNDPTFRKWVYKGENDAMWVSYIKNTPLQIDNIERARQILIMIRGEIQDVPSDELTIRRNVLVQYAEQSKQTKSSWSRRNWAQIAAVFVLVAGLGGYYWNRVTVPAYNAILTTAGHDSIIEIVNDDEKVKLVTLPDGSSVLLKKAARISYPSQFTVDKREVVMLGEAFFEIQKITNKPFVIYSNEMVTEVTGTSFSVKANEGADHVQLVVKSGTVKISVKEKYKRGDNKNLVLNKNQLVSLDLKNGELKSQNVNEPVLINLPIESQFFVFKNTPVKEVLKALELAYGVRIHLDKEETFNCNITATLGDGPIHEKLEMICDVLDARFTMKDHSILVYANGCD